MGILIISVSIMAILELSLIHISCHLILKLIQFERYIPFAQTVGGVAFVVMPEFKIDILTVGIIGSRFSFLVVDDQIQEMFLVLTMLSLIHI